MALAALLYMMFSGTCRWDVDLAGRRGHNFHVRVFVQKMNSGATAVGLRDLAGKVYGVLVVPETFQRCQTVEKVLVQTFERKNTWLQNMAILISQILGDSCTPSSPEHLSTPLGAETLCGLRGFSV